MKKKRGGEVAQTQWTKKTRTYELDCADKLSSQTYNPIVKKNELKYNKKIEFHVKK